MSWPRGAPGTTLWTDTEAIPAAAMNAIGAAFEEWQDNVNANEKNLSALGNLTFATGKGIVQDAWQPLTLQNSWVSYGDGNQAPQYRKDKQGFVHVRFAVKNGTITNGTAVFTLPVGYRPPAHLPVPIAVLTPAAGAAAIMVIQSTGACLIYGVGGSSLVAGSFCFSTEA
jgi:hypothetical protein